MNLKGYHWTDGGSIRLGLHTVDAIYSDGKGWGKRNVAYIYRVGRTFTAVYVSKSVGGTRWDEMEFDSDTTLEEAQAAVETVLKLEEEEG